MSHERAGPLALAAGVLGLGLSFLVGSLAIPGEAAYAGVGPRAFPVLIGGALAVLGVALGLTALGGGLEAKAEGGEDVDPTRPADLGAVGWIIGGLLLSIFTLRPLGFPIAAALLFTWTARAFGSRKILIDGLLGLGLGLAAFFLFARALGVSLPGGPLDWR